MMRGDSLQMGDRIWLIAIGKRAPGVVPISELIPDCACNMRVFASHISRGYWRQTPPVAPDAITHFICGGFFTVARGNPSFSHSKLTASASPYMPNIGTNVQG